MTGSGPAGKVTIDRSDFAARADSLRLDTGAESDGTLIGNPMLRGIGSDSFKLTGRRIDLRFDHRELTYLTALGDGHAVSAGRRSQGRYGRARHRQGEADPDGGLGRQPEARRRFGGLPVAGRFDGLRHAG